MKKNEIQVRFKKMLDRMGYSETSNEENYLITLIMHIQIQ